MRYSRPIGLNLLLCLVCFGNAWAKDDKKPELPKLPPPPDFTKLFKELDANGDGKLSKAEYLSQFALPGKPGEKIRELMSKQYEKLDADKDGFILPEEFKKLPFSFLPIDIDPDRIKKMIENIDPETLKRLTDQFRAPGGGIIIDTDQIKKMIQNIDPETLKKMLEQLREPKP